MSKNTTYLKKDYSDREIIFLMSNINRIKQIVLESKIKFSIIGKILQFTLKNESLNENEIIKLTTKVNFIINDLKKKEEKISIDSVKKEIIKNKMNNLFKK